MFLAVFNTNRLGIVEMETVYDVTDVVQCLPPLRWPIPRGDRVIAQLTALRSPLKTARSTGARYSIRDVSLHSPVTSPTKIVAAPANYRAHVELDAKDPGVDVAMERAQILALARPIDRLGLFLKSSTSLVGPAEGVTIDWPGGEDRRCDHEVEFAVVIGQTARHVSRLQAFEYIAGYAVGLDITIRGSEDRSYRKSLDTFTVLGPWLATPDELHDPNDTTLWLTVNGELRQRSSTRLLTVGIAELIELASSVYTLYPGDIILTGTPEGVGPIEVGDVIRAGCSDIGEMALSVKAPEIRNV